MANKKWLTPNFNTFYLVRLLIRCYWKNGTVLFTDLILPIIIMSILYNSLDILTVNYLVPGVILSSVASSGFISFAIFLVEWKNSVLMKKLKVFQISNLQFFLTFLLFFSCISQFLFWICFAYTLFLEQIGLAELEGTLNQLSNVDWGYAMLGLIQLILITNIMGFVITFFVKKSNAVIGICLTLFTIQAFLIGYYLPMNLVVENPSIRTVSYMMPFYGPTRIFQTAWLQDLKVVYGPEHFYQFENWSLSYSYPEKANSITIINFDKSYWSLILLSLGWTTMGLGLATLLNKYKKLD